MSTRRDFFRQAAAFAGGAQSMSALLSSIERASAIDPHRGSSFRRCRAYRDPDAGESIFRSRFRNAARGSRVQRSAGGDAPGPEAGVAADQCARERPTRLSGWTSKDTKATWLGSLPHSLARPDRRPQSRKPRRLAWTRRSRIAKIARACRSPWVTTIAKTFPSTTPSPTRSRFAINISARTLTGTTPNRLHLWTGTIREKPDAASDAERAEFRCRLWIHGELEDFSGAAGGGGDFVAHLSE